MLRVVKPFYLYCGLLLLFVVCATQASAQHSKFDSLLNLYAAKHRPPVLFMHFDKNVYSNNENVWFAGYLIDQADSVQYKTLSLALVKNDDRSVLMDDRFIIDGGFCFGNTNIPDSVRAGAYTFVAYGSRLLNDVPDLLFTQQVTIKTETQPGFSASLNPLDTSATAVNQKVMLLVNFADAKSAPAAVPVTYYVGNAQKPVTTGAVKTANGQYIFNIPSNLLSAVNNKLNVQVKYKKEVQDISMVLPVPPQLPQVQFFPESGNIVTGTVNTVGWEAKAAIGGPLYTAALLYEDKQVIDSIHTASNGMGRFLFIPQINKQYYVKVAGSNKTYDLPSVVNSPAIKVAKAVVNDTLIIDIHNDIPSRKLYLLGHNYKQTFFEAVVEKRASQRLKIILKDVPRGILQLTLVDSAGRPYAERLAFAHYSNPSKLDITADNGSYATRKKVKLSISLSGDADNAAVSVAVVQENRIELKSKNSIESYLHLKSKLGDIPFNENYFSNADFDRRALEEILLIKGWSRYKWTDVLKTANKSQRIEDAVMQGRVTKNAGKLKQSLMLVTLKPYGMYNTDINGKFLLADEDIITEPDKKITIMVAGDNPSDYNVQIVSPYDSLNKKMAERIDIPHFHSAAQENSAGLQLTGNERAIRLKEAVIKDRKVDDSFYGSSRLFSSAHANACGDYVCRYNILNCPNHRNDGANTAPVKGRLYQNVIYQGCVVEEKQEARQNSIKFKGIYAAQEFYPSDYSEISPSQPEYISTIYWKNQLLLEKGKPQDVSFYTSDITGPFKIIVQGVTNKDVIYSETSFKVTK